MIGNTDSALCPWWSTTTAPVSVMSPTITPKLACAASSAGITPGRARISRSGAGGPSGMSGPVPAARIIAMRRGSGRTHSTSTSPTTMNALPASQSCASTSPDSSRPDSSGLKTAGPRMAPNTEPNRIDAMPRARCSGGYMSPAAVRASRAVALAAPTHMSPPRTAGAKTVALPSPASPQPAAPVPKPSARIGTRPTRSMARPAGSAASAPEVSTIAGPRPSSPLMSSTLTSVSEATAAESCSMAELMASAAASRMLFRRIGREAGPVTARA